MLKLTFVVFLLFIVLAPAALHACPGWNELLNDQVGRAFNPSVLFMMAMPFAVVGTIAGGIAYTYWRAQKRANCHDHNGDEATKS